MRAGKGKETNRARMAASTSETLRSQTEVRPPAAYQTKGGVGKVKEAAKRKVDVRVKGTMNTRVDVRARAVYRISTTRMTASRPGASAGRQNWNLVGKTTSRAYAREKTVSRIQTAGLGNPIRIPNNSD